MLDSWVGKRRQIAALESEEAELLVQQIAIHDAGPDIAREPAGRNTGWSRLFLDATCRSHHTLKHPDAPEVHRWTAQQRQDGTITWFSPLGRGYPDPPSRCVMFV